MALSAVFLDNVVNINSFDEKKQIELYEGQIQSVYIMLKDLKGTRYVPQGVFGVSINFPSLDNAQSINVSASQPFADDKSIFRVDIPSNFRPKTGAIVITLTEDSVIKTILIDQAIVMHLLNQGSN